MIPVSSETFLPSSPPGSPCEPFPALLGLPEHMLFHAWKGTADRLENLFLLLLNFYNRHQEEHFNTSSKRRETRKS